MTDTNLVAGGLVEQLAGTEALHQHPLLQDLALVMIMAGVVTLVFHQLRQPVVLGYILAGLIIGPYLLPVSLVQDQANVRTLAELGVVFLMFALGMDFSLRTLRRIGVTAVIGALVEIGGMLWIGYQLGRLFGWSAMDCLFLGAILAISSTTITIKVLTEMDLIKERFAELAIGILIIEDIVAIALIAFLSGVATTGKLALGSVLVTVGQVAVFLTVVLIVGLIFVPRLLRYVASYKSAEMMLVMVLGLCFGVSLLTVKLGYSVALGAFVIGMVIGEAREIGRIRVLTEPVRDMFSAVFFVSIGMLIEPRLLVAYAGPIAVITVVVLIGKVVTRTFGVFAAGNDLRVSLRVGLTLAQIGEFSFIIAALGLSLRQTSAFLYPIAVCVSVITTLLTPYLVRAADPLADRFDRWAPTWLIGLIKLYSGWLDRVQRGRPDAQTWRLARRWLMHILVNIVLATGVLLAAGGVGRWAREHWTGVPDAVGGPHGLVWVIAAVIALPALIAALRKLRALAMLVSEMSVSVAGGRITASTRKIVERTVFVTGTLAVAVWVLMLSAALLPGGVVVVALVSIVSLVTILLWRFFIQVHAKAQRAILETFAATPPAIEIDRPQQLILAQAKVEPVTVRAGSAVDGKLLREIELRTVTGVSAVGIERAGVQTINPGPDEELRAGDKLLLLGNPDQLAAARKLISGPAGT